MISCNYCDRKRINLIISISGFNISDFVGFLPALQTNNGTADSSEKVFLLSIIRWINIVIKSRLLCFCY